MNNYEKIVREPYEYVTKEKGKEVRVKLIEAFNQFTELKEEQLNVIKEITQKLHNASLLIDDIEDNSKLRRGKPCAHLIYGMATTINSANYIYFESLKDVVELNSAKATKVFMDELVNLHLGQGMDIYWRDQNVCPTEEEYLTMVTQKTGGLFRLAIGLMEAISEKDLNLTPLINNLSILFQILDDYLNLQSNKYHQNKSFCEDFTEGKFSYPIIHHLNNTDKTDKRVLNILSKRTEDVELKKYALECMGETNTFDYTLKVLKKYEQLCLKQIEELGGNKYLDKILNYLMQQIPQQQQENIKRLESLLKNPNFYDDLNYWSSSNDNLVDVKSLSIYKDPNSKENFLSFDLSKEGIHQAVFQATFNLKSIKNPLLISLEYLIKSNEKKLKGNFYSYIQIKYSDSTIKNIWIKPSKGFLDGQFLTKCVFVPYMKPMENIIVSIGGNPSFENLKDEQILIRSLNIETLDESLNYSKFKMAHQICHLSKKPLQEDYHIQENYLKSDPDLKIEKNDLTITTHLTVDRLNFLIENVKSFKGPISASIFIKNNEELLQLMEIHSNNFELRKYVTFHLILLNKKFKVPFIYPTNLMRNIARRNVKTFFFLAMDVSFIVAPNLYQMTTNNILMKIFTHFPSKFKTLLILPCYHQFYKTRPQHKGEIKKYLYRGRIKRFEQWSHKISNFEEWERNSKEFYDVTSKFEYSEPFYISTKEEPEFSERYIGCGRDRLSHLAMMKMMGFKFFVWGKQFLVHGRLTNKYQRLCEVYPPKNEYFHAMAAHYWMEKSNLLVKIYHMFRCSVRKVLNNCTKFYSKHNYVLVNNLEIKKSTTPEFLEWLKTKHIHDVLACDGFKYARLYFDELNEHKNETDLVSIHYYNESKEKLEKYFENEGKKFREEGQEKWGNKMKVLQRKLLKWDYFEKKMK
eukprot:gene10004-2323_t